MTWEKLQRLTLGSVALIFLAAWIIFLINGVYLWAEHQAHHSIATKELVQPYLGKDAGHARKFVNTHKGE